MQRAIGYESLQVNAIRIIAHTRNQEKSESPRVKELSKSGSRKSLGKEGHSNSRRNPNSQGKPAI